jgi:hypothetical protein
VFRGVGQIVAVPRQVGDPANVSRVDLVYSRGTMHLVARGSGATFTVDPHSCLFRATTREDAQIEGGTGIFAHASGTCTGTVSPQGVLPRNPDGSCATGEPALHEVDQIEFSGTLSF